jgi:hypothetical protein
MREDDVVRYISARPFRPFRAHLTNGETIDVRHPELAWVTRSTMVVAIPSAQRPVGVIDDYVTIALLHINKIDHLPAQTAERQQ